MVCQQEQIRKDKFSKRMTNQYPIVLASDRQVGEGRVLDISECDCLVESSLLVKVGDAVQLRLSLPRREPSIRVPRAAVRWTDGSKFVVDFIEMEEKSRVRLNHFLALHGTVAQDCGR